MAGYQHNNNVSTFEGSQAIVITVKIEITVNALKEASYSLSGANLINPKE